jgi:prepilin-type N-terminal cleavage/methylation domain-containing protein
MMKTKKSAFTLVELIVSMGIVAILAAALFAVGSYIDTQMKIKRTQATIQLLVTAIEQYYDFNHKFPDKSSDIYLRLTSIPESRKIVEQIERKAIKKDASNKLVFIDAWGSNIFYDYAAEWNFPVVISGGPDKKIGNQPNDPNGIDDISSKGM